MTQKEMNCSLEERSKALKSRFENRYKKSVINGWTCFARPNGSYFTLYYILPFGALVIGYAETKRDAELNRFENGDLFYLEDMDEETMFQSMLEEINS